MASVVKVNSKTKNDCENIMGLRKMVQENFTIKLENTNKVVLRNWYKRHSQIHSYYNRSRALSNLFSNSFTLTVKSVHINISGSGAFA